MSNQTIFHTNWLDMDDVQDGYDLYISEDQYPIIDPVNSSLHPQLNFSYDHEVIGQDATVLENDDFNNSNFNDFSIFGADRLGIMDVQLDNELYNSQHLYSRIDLLDYIFYLQPELILSHLESSLYLSISSSPSNATYPFLPISSSPSNITYPPLPTSSFPSSTIYSSLSTSSSPSNATYSSLPTSSPPSNAGYPSPPVAEGNNDSIRSMRLEVINIGNGRFQCSGCSNNFTRQQDVIRHFTTHTNERNVHCEHCLRSFGRRDSLIRHQRTCRSNPSRI